MVRVQSVILPGRNCGREGFANLLQHCFRLPWQSEACWFQLAACRFARQSGCFPGHFHPTALRNRDRSGESVWTMCAAEILAA